MVILAGDIGGTNARLGLFEPDGVSLRKVTTARFPSREHASLEEIVEQFLAKVRGQVQRACFAVAGPVSEGRVAATNLAWIVDTGGLARVVGLETVRLINDLEAIAHGLGNRETPTWLCSTRGTRAAKGTGRSSPPAQAWERPVPTGTGAATTRSHARAGTATSGPGRASRWSS
jgi:glucokinase